VSSKTVPYLIAQDFSNRIAVEAGLARLPDYRDELAELIRQKNKTRKAYCEATGISESLLSHVLHGLKDMAINTLQEALAKIGYQLQIAPRPEAELAGKA
jgi:predicted transcriptional regulator